MKGRRPQEHDILVEVAKISVEIYQKICHGKNVELSLMHQVYDFKDVEIRVVALKN